MQNHSTGPITGTRLGADIVLHTIPLAYSNTTAAAKIVIEASATKPVWLRVGFLTKTAFNGTTPTVSIGSTTSANEYLNGVTPAAANAAYSTPVERLLTEDTTIYAKAGGGGSNTAGAGYILLEMAEINVYEP